MHTWSYKKSELIEVFCYIFSNIAGHCPPFCFVFREIIMHVSFVLVVSKCPSYMYSAINSTAFITPL